MYTFIFSVLLLFFGYFCYSKFIDKIFGSDENRPVPATEYADGMDFIIMPTWKSFLIQFLNIAGMGPIFGAVAGAMWGAKCLFVDCFWLCFCGRCA